MARQKTRAVIRIPATITKAEFQTVVAFYGCTNSGQFSGHPSGVLKLETFAGAYSNDKSAFVGEYRFTTTSEPTPTQFDRLPGCEFSGVKAIRAKKENTNG